MARAKKASEEKKTARVADYQILIAPLVTEKSSALGGTLQRVAFEVDRRATKSDIKAAVEAVFNVKVEGVSTCNYMGKMKRTSRSVGRRSAFKKAYVTLQEGQSINIVEGV